MTWTNFGFLGGGILLGAFLTLGFVALTIGSQLREIKNCLNILIFKSKRGRKPRSPKIPSSHEEITP